MSLKVQVPNVVFSWCELGFIGCKLDADLFQHPSSSLQLQARIGGTHWKNFLQSIQDIYCSCNSEAPKIFLYCIPSHESAGCNAVHRYISGIVRLLIWNFLRIYSSFSLIICRRLLWVQIHCTGFDLFKIDSSHRYVWQTKAMLPKINVHSAGILSIGRQRI